MSIFGFCGGFGFVLWWVLVISRGEVEIKYDETVREIKGGLELCTDPVGRLGGEFFGGGGDGE